MVFKPALDLDLSTAQINALVADQVLTTPEAAKYIGLSVSGIKTHIYRSKTLAPLKVVGRVALFTKVQLDEWQESRRSPGRPVGSTPASGS